MQRARRDESSERLLQPHRLLRLLSRALEALRRGAAIPHVRAARIAAGLIAVAAVRIVWMRLRAALAVVEAVAGATRGTAPAAAAAAAAVALVTGAGNEKQRHHYRRDQPEYHFLDHCCSPLRNPYFASTISGPPCLDKVAKR